MRSLIFGGTTEGRAVSSALAEKGAEVTVCVATEYGAEEQEKAENISVLVGRKDSLEMQKILPAYDVCIDATHPYAIEVTKNLKQACAECGVLYVRLLRAESTSAEGAIYVNSAAEAAEFLEKTEGNILLTTGTKELPAFSELKRERIYPRILPMTENLEICEREYIPRKNIIAMHGPFEQELNEALMAQFAIKYMVTKDGGKAGGFSEKIDAAKNRDVQVLIIRRPMEEGRSYEEVLHICEEMMRCR